MLVTAIFFAADDWFKEGEINSRRDVRPETDGREETGGTGQYGSGFRRPEERF